MIKWCLIFLLLLSVPVWAEEVPPPVDYGEYLEQVVAYYPLLKKEQASVEKAIAAKAVIATEHMPRFWASIGSEYGNDPVYVFGTLLRQNRFSNSDFELSRLNTPKSRRDTSAAFGGEWLLFDFFQTTGKLKASGFVKESAVYQQEFTRMEAILAASEIYDRLDTTDQWLKVLNQQAEAGQKDIAAMETLQNKGLVLGADFFMARMRLAELVELKTEVANQRAALEMVFNILRGVEPLTPVVVETSSKSLPSLTTDVGEYTAQALSNRLDIKATAKMLEASEAGAEVQKKSLAPKIVAYGDMQEHGKSLTSETGESYMVGLKAKFDLDPGYHSKVKLARAETQQLAAQLLETKDAAARQTAEAYYRLKTLQTNVPSVEQKLADAKEALRLLLPLYQEGQRSILDIISARMAEVVSYEQWLKLKASSRLTMLDLQLLTGSLTPLSAKEVYGQ